MIKEHPQYPTSQQNNTIMLLNVLFIHKDMKGNFVENIFDIK